MAQQCFHNWFNSPYYHLLYNKRDDKVSTLADFEQFFKLNGFEIAHQFGNYSLDDFNGKTAIRLIFICKKAHA